MAVVDLVSFSRSGAMLRKRTCRLYSVLLNLPTGQVLLALV